jgi:NADH:ubiquinone oxidoreductase subunit 2 (subunit N)
MQAWLMPIADAVPKQISAFLLTLSKLGLAITLASMSSLIAGLLLISSQFNLIIGSVAALYERRYKRLFAWLSLTQLGYFLLAISFVQTANAVAYFEHYFAYTILLLLLYNQSSIDLANLTKNWYTSYSLVFIIALFSVAGLPPAALFWAKLEFLAQLSSQAVVIALIATLVSSLIYVRLIRVFTFYS